jgi:hypothetical protein
MSQGLHFPPFTNVWTVLTIFGGELLIFHLLLVIWLRLGKRAWKVVDYFWLAFAALGLFGPAGQARQLVASNMISTSNWKTQISYMQVLSFVDEFSNEGPACRTFVRSQHSPPPDEFQRTQKDFDSVCHWFRDVQRKLPRPVDNRLEEVGPSNLPPEPAVSEADLRDMLRLFHTHLDVYNADAKEYASILQATKHSATEELLILTSPLLLSSALALRITKVTGEIRLN